MAQSEGNLRERYAEDRDYLERLMDLEHLLDATLGGFAVTSALAQDAEVTVGVSGREQQVESARFLTGKRRTNNTRFQVLFTA